MPIMWALHIGTAKRESLTGSLSMVDDLIAHPHIRVGGWLLLCQVSPVQYLLQHLRRQC